MPHELNDVSCVRWGFDGRLESSGGFLTAESAHQQAPAVVDSTEDEAVGEEDKAKKRPK